MAETARRSNPMSDVVEGLAQSLRVAGRELELSIGFRPRGVINQVGDGVAFVVGLEDIGYEELLALDSGAYGMAYDLGKAGIGAVLLSGADQARSGDGVQGLRRLPSLPVGPETLGRIIDPLGNPLDDGPPLRENVRLPLFRPAPEFIDRKGVDQPLLTGVMVIDAAIPIGRGQRELIIGDRNTGKTAIALDMVANQRAGDVACVYVVIGQPMSRVLSLRDTLRRAGALSNTAIVAADASMAPGMQYLAPYAGASVAEWFREHGSHSVVIYDDLTKHADAYRELALLLGRPPGREAFPGDIFYIHAELLERATALREQSGGGSVTAFPIVETTDSDISGYIPTNLISITDGQIYLDAARFERNQRPAVDIGRSVSRIGSAAQSAAMKTAARNLRILMSRFEALEALTRVGLDIDESTQSVIRRGRVMRELLRQPRLALRSTADQVLLLTATSKGWLDDCELGSLAARVASILRRSRTEAAEVMSAIDGGTLPDQWIEKLAVTVRPDQAGGGR
jgi:F-type H+-transporting ATPase subunit alpha